MSYIAFDLDALNRAPAVARAAGMREEDVIAGLVRLWAWCFREENDQATQLQVKGLFGVDCCEALAAFSFLEASGAGWRVRGAARYLRVKEAQRGAARRTNQRRAQRESTEDTATVGHRSTVQSTDAQPSGEATPLHRAPSTEHRTPNTEHHEQPPIVVDGASTFFAWAQDERQQTAGLVREKPPHPRALSSWCSEAMLQTGGDFERLKAGYRAFLVNPFWRNEARVKCAWTGWVAQWRDFVPATVGGVASPWNTRSPVAAEAVDWSNVQPGEVAL